MSLRIRTAFTCSEVSIADDGTWTITDLADVMLASRYPANLNLFLVIIADVDAADAHRDLGFRVALEHDGIEYMSGDAIHPARPVDPLPRPTAASVDCPDVSGFSIPAVGFYELVITVAGDEQARLPLIARLLDPKKVREIRGQLGEN